MNIIGTFSRGIAANPSIAALLDAEAVRFNPGDHEAGQLNAVVGWGLKSNTERARRYAERHGLRYLTLEDGFVRSVGLGVDGAQGLSVVVDDVGVFYDASSPSRLEVMLESDDAVDLVGLAERARRCAERIRTARLSKYNIAALCDLPPRDPGSPERVLVVDQTAGDLSIQHGQLIDGGIPAMLEAAYSQFPEAEIWIKAHPDVIAGKRDGHLSPQTVNLSAGQEQRTRWILEQTDSLDLLSRVDRVHVGTSQMGFEALLIGKPVSCFGLPYYAGWGLTDDRVTTPRRTRSRTLEEVFAAAYLVYARYWHPVERRRVELEDVLEHLELQVRMARENRGRFFCFGMSRWKRSWVKDYLRSPGNSIFFARNLRDARRHGLGEGRREKDGLPDRIVVWGQRAPREVERFSEEKAVPLWRMEDGFLRSVGLGSDLTVASSLVVDSRGIYYDPSKESDLEWILQHHEFDPDLCRRADDLADLIVSNRISKYNLSDPDGDRLLESPWAGDPRTAILVPGQVEDDASILLGCGDTRTNRGLLRRVKELNPGACIIYKPHPDVLSGNRKGGVLDDELSELCDYVVLDTPIARCLDWVDEIHTMTSLVGFEGLVHKKRVTCHGAPFYSGWGLTCDRMPVARRGRKLRLSELVAGALIVYPRYLSARDRSFTTPEQIVAQLREQLERGSPEFARRPWVARRWSQLSRLVKGLRHAG